MISLFFLVVSLILIFAFFRATSSRKVVERAQEERQYSLSSAYAHLAGALPDQPLISPEKMWTYNDKYLYRYKLSLEHANVNERYIYTILRGWDIVFAIMLSMVSTLINFTTFLHFYWGCFSAIALGCTGMALIYGICDIGENLLLAYLLGGQPIVYPRITPVNAAVANILTRAKILTLLFSVSGICIFVFLLVIQRLRRSAARC